MESPNRQRAGAGGAYSSPEYTRGKRTTGQATGLACRDETPYVPWALAVILVSSTAFVDERDTSKFEDRSVSSRLGR